MAGELKAYEQKLAEVKEAVRVALRDVRKNATEVAAWRGALAIMETELKTQPGAVRRFEGLRSKQMTGPELWLQTSLETAYKPLRRAEVDPAAWKAKMLEYELFLTEIRKRQALDQSFHDKFQGVIYVTQENPQVVGVLSEIVFAFGQWTALHTTDRNFLPSPQAALLGMLMERQDLVEALRDAQALPKDTSIWRVPVDRPAMVEVVEIAISFVPYLGTAVALLEAATGKDIFGYQLDPTDRAILAAGALLPFAARFVKGGRALYTAARLERMYGRDAARFSRILGMGERISGNQRFVGQLRKARKLTMAGSKAEARTVEEIANGLKQLDLKAAREQIKPLPQKVADALKKLGSGKPILAELDAPAIARVVEKEIKIHMRGQLLEEFLEARITAWLRDPAGAAALGVDAKDVVFLPGHMLRHPTGGRQITDGVLARRIGDSLEIVAIFEAKSSVRAVKELRAAKTGASALTKAERIEIRKVAREELEDALELAAQEGRVHTKTLADHEAELLKPLTQKEEGQLRRSIERLYENDDLGRLSTVRINGAETKITMSPTKTKVFGVVPKGTDIPKLEQECRALGFNFEALGVDVTSRELDEMADALAAAAGIVF